MELQAYKKQSKQYYNNATKFSSGMELSILTRLRYYVAQTFYNQEIDALNYATSLKDLVKRRVFPANMNNDFAMRSEVQNSVHTSNQNNDDVNYFSNNQFPFTVYNLGDSPELIDEEKNTPAAMSRVYSQELGTYVTAIPIRQTYEFISFFSTAQDYDEAMLRFSIDNAVLTRVDFPILLNNIEYTFHFDLAWEVAKGEYTSDFELYLEKNRIYDIVHNATVTYMYIVSNKNVTVYPVTDMAVSLYNKDINDINTLLTNIALPTVHNHFTVATNFVNAQIGWNKSTALIFTFSTPIVETSFTSNFSIDPVTLGRWTISTDGTTFTFTPFGGQFLASKLYTITIPKMKIQSETGYWYKNDITLTFTTGV